MQNYTHLIIPTRLNYFVSSYSISVRLTHRDRKILLLLREWRWLILPSARTNSLIPFCHIKIPSIRWISCRSRDRRSSWSPRCFEAHESEIAWYYLQFAWPVSAFRWRHLMAHPLPSLWRSLRDTHLHAVSITWMIHAWDNVRLS